MKGFPEKQQIHQKTLTWKTIAKFSLEQIKIGG